MRLDQVAQDPISALTVALSPFPYLTPMSTRAGIHYDQAMKEKTRLNVFHSWIDLECDYKCTRAPLRMLPMEGIKGNSPIKRSFGQCT